MNARFDTSKKSRSKDRVNIAQKNERITRKVTRIMSYRNDSRQKKRGRGIVTENARNETSRKASSLRGQEEDKITQSRRKTVMCT